MFLSLYFTMSKMGRVHPTQLSEVGGGGSGTVRETPESSFGTLASRVPKAIRGHLVHEWGVPGFTSA